MPSENTCAGPFGAIYDFYIERPWLMKAIGRVVWGVDAGVLYEAIEPLEGVNAGATIIDVPCGGGVAFRALHPEQDIRYLAGDISPRMLQRAGERATARRLEQVELAQADMTDLPYPDGCADYVLCLSGLHMLNEPQRAVSEIARCLKPGGRLIGATFLLEGTRRARYLFASAHRRGHPLPPRREELRTWLTELGLQQSEIGPQRGFALFSARAPD